MRENEKIVIFDMDGVLTDSEPAITQASIESLAEWNITAKHEDFKQFTGMGDDKFIGGVANIYGVEYDLDMKKRAYEIYVDTARERVKVFHWSKPLILKLKSAGYTLAIASASDLTKVNCNIECIGVDTAIFNAIVTGSDVVNKKPAPDIFLKASEKAGMNFVSLSNTVVIEDALSGCQAAKAAGATCIAVTTSFAREQLAEAGADYITDDLNEAFDIISSVLTIE